MYQFKGAPLQLSWKKCISNFSSCATSTILLQYDFRWVTGNYVLVYLINLGTRNFFGITMFGTIHISTTCTGSYKFTPSMTLILAFSITILSWSIPFHDFIIFGFATGVAAANCTKAGFCCGSSTLFMVVHCLYLISHYKSSWRTIATSISQCLLE